MKGKVNIRKQNRYRSIRRPQRTASTIINPQTGRMVKVGGPTYRRLGLGAPFDWKNLPPEIQVQIIKGNGEEAWKDLALSEHSTALFPCAQGLEKTLIPITVRLPLVVGGEFFSVNNPFTGLILLTEMELSNLRGDSATFMLGFQFPKLPGKYGTVQFPSLHISDFTGEKRGWSSADTISFPNRTLSKPVQKDLINWICSRAIHLASSPITVKFSPFEIGLYSPRPMTSVLEGIELAQNPMMVAVTLVRFFLNLEMFMQRNDSVLPQLNDSTGWREQLAGRKNKWGEYESIAGITYTDFLILKGMLVEDDWVHLF